MKYSPNLSYLSPYQKGIYSSGIKEFKNLPPSNKSLIDNIQKFKSVFKKMIYMLIPAIL
jgi:hypothetical protein